MYQNYTFLHFSQSHVKHHNLRDFFDRELETKTQIIFELPL